jgi:hypothetical protein
MRCIVKKVTIISFVFILIASSSSATPTEKDVGRGTTQLLSTIKFTIPPVTMKELGSSIDVSNCSEVRFSSRAFNMPTSIASIECFLIDDLSGAILETGTIDHKDFPASPPYYSLTILINTPMSSSLAVKCYNWNQSPVDINAALYCR